MSSDALFRIAAILLVTPGIVEASCGLPGCPTIPEVPVERLAVRTWVQETSFDLEGVTGSYLMITPHLELSPEPPVRLGAFAPMVRLRRDDLPQDTGWANPVVYGEVDAWRRAGPRVSAGLQLELPLGDSEKGMAGDHLEVFPYARWSGPLRFAVFHAQTGYRAAVGASEEGEDGHPQPSPPAGAAGVQFHGTSTSASSPGFLVVNPHSEQEWLWRVGGGLNPSISRWTPALFLEGHTVTKGPDEGETYAFAEAFLAYSFETRYQVNVLARVPVSEARRFDFTTVLAASAVF